MIDRPLRSIRLANFRSIPGEFRLPLDAQVILIHGPNGSGKTSILSAIELALTGEVQSLARVDGRYFAHIPHHGQDFAAVDIEIADIAGDVHRHDVMTVGPGGLDGTPALEGSARRFYSERAYLDQYALGRLLEIYQHTETNQESSLERFVNELLGLDELDALVGGLDDTLHVGRLRKTVGRFAAAESDQASGKERIKTATAERRTLEAEIEAAESELVRLCGQLGSLDRQFSEVPTLEELSGQGELLRLRQRLDDGRAATNQLTELRGRLSGLAAWPTQVRRRDALRARAAVTARLDEWQGEYLAPMSHLSSAAERLGIQAERDPRDILRVQSDIERTTGEVAELLERHDLAMAETADLDRRTAEAEDATEEISLRTSEEEEIAGTLATGLSAIMEHVDGEICPVCDRDFSELSDQGLRSHLQEKVQAIAGKGADLRQLREARSAAQLDLAELRQRRDDAARRMLEDADLARIQDQRSLLDAFASELESASAWLIQGVEILDRLQVAEDEIAEGEHASEERREIDQALSAIGAQLGAEDAAGTSEETLQSLLDLATQEVDSATALHAVHSEAIESATGLRQMRADLGDSTSAIADLVSRQDELDSQIRQAQERRDVAKAVHSAALDERSEIIRRVFNQSLNKVWRDVFVRLAPDEVFVPAFGIPQVRRRSVSFALETVHRSGEIGGSPGAMLSAGNLNTAALSLFISLHLAAEPVVPCLVLDDPIQSMDEVHVSQFAALIRTLSKQLGRQVVIAVHERELFEYLCLELSPAFEGDRLITIELGSQTSTSREPLVEKIEYEPDLAVAM